MIWICRCRGDSCRGSKRWGVKKDVLLQNDKILWSDKYPETFAWTYRTDASPTGSLYTLELQKGLALAGAKEGQRDLPPFFRLYKIVLIIKC